MTINRKSLHNQQYGVFARVYGNYLPGIASRRNAPSRIIHGRSLPDISVTSSRNFGGSAIG